MIFKKLKVFSFYDKQNIYEREKVDRYLVKGEL